MYIFICNPNIVEKTSSTTTTDYNDMPFMPLFALFMNIVFLAIDGFGVVASLVPRLKSFLKTRAVNISSSEIFDKSRVSDGDAELGALTREELEAVMERLGLFCGRDDESERLRESFGGDELSRLFDESEPSFEEIKEAFVVFDVNRDGFIDAAELQRVLGLLGLRQYGSDIERCKRMIQNVDSNGDGKIDFHDFVKFMETIFC